MTDDTISAVATAIGEGGIGIVRMSGDKAIDIVDKIFVGTRGRSVKNLSTYSAMHGKIMNPDDGSTVDEVLVFVMRNPGSYTREDVVEIHCHGGPIPLRNILHLTLRYGARMAEPGEFTKRAFLNGRIDLAQAEAVMDVIRSKTDASLRMALNQLDGRLSAKIRNMRDNILSMLAHLEAVIDFPEEDIEDITVADIVKNVKSMLVEIDNLLSTAQTGRILQEGLQTVIIGKPNVGKSSLLNALLREKRAIVTDVPGTTRDIIEEYVNIRGIPLKIADTAGIRETDDLVEKIGVEKARLFLNRADFILLILDASKPLSDDDIEILDLLADKEAIILVNKSDLPTKMDFNKLKSLCKSKKVIHISVLEGLGLDELEQSIVDFVYSGQIIASDAGFIHNVRHIDYLEQVRSHLLDVKAASSLNMPVDCLTIDLRDAWDKLGKITGETVGEDILNEIFSRFCIGK